MSGQRLGHATEPACHSGGSGGAHAPGRPCAPPAPDGARGAAAAPRPALRAHSHPTVMCSAARPARLSVALSSPLSALCSFRPLAPSLCSLRPHLPPSLRPSLRRWPGPAWSPSLRRSPCGLVRPGLRRSAGPQLAVSASRRLRSLTAPCPRLCPAGGRSAQTQRPHLEAERLAGHAVVDGQEVLERQLAEVCRAHLEHGPARTAPRLSAHRHARDADRCSRVRDGTGIEAGRHRHG